MQVDITGLDKSEVLMALYLFAIGIKNRAVGLSTSAETVYTPEQIRNCREKGKNYFDSPEQKPFGYYLDYVQLGLGPVCIKADLARNTFDATDYDRALGGSNAATTAIEELKKQKNASSLVVGSVFSPNGKTAAVTSTPADVGNSIRNRP